MSAVHRGPATVLAWMLFLLPTVGVPSQLVLQDTLKSAVLALGVLAAALLFFWQERQRAAPLRWHGLVWLPLVLMVYALGSMVWSHAYLAGVEAIRWLVLSLLLWLGLNTINRTTLPTLLWGVHAGTVGASVWVALQFWFDLGLFPQAAFPASTFINRNFFAEYAVCALPFSVYVLANLRRSYWPGWVAFSVAFNIVAILMEPSQGEGGLHPMRADYLKKVRELCDAKGWLLMMDEVQAGMGRTGKWFAHQWAGITPDVMTLAKGLGSGVPVGAVVAHNAAAKVLTAGNHGSTFGGNPLSMRAGVETIRIMEEDGLLAHTTEVGEYLKAQLHAALSSLDGYVEVRGQGLMIGVELTKPCGQLIGQAAEAGLLLSVTADTVIRLVPPLILSKSEADEIVAKLKPLVQAVLAA